MKFYGLQKTTLIDYPEEIAATLFTFGCNLRCPYCHNPELLIKNKNTVPIDWDEILIFLKKRKNVLGGVCITGGEPLLHDEIYDVIKEIKSLGLKVKIDTNGTLPEKLKKLDVDYIAMDIKTSLKKYKMLNYTGVDEIEKLIEESINWIINSKILHEFRTTVVPEIVEFEDIKEIIKLIKGTRKYVLAQFRPEITLDLNWKNIIPYPIEILMDMKNIIDQAGIICEIRDMNIIN